MPKRSQMNSFVVVCFSSRSDLYISTGDFRQNVINRMYRKIIAAAKFRAFLDVSNGIHAKGNRWMSKITIFFDKS
jgi:hypothetical protein